MSFQPARLLFPLILLLAFTLREAGPPGVELERAASTALAPESAWILRRVELTLQGDRLPQFDRQAQHPDGSVATDPPLFPLGLALAAGFLGGDELGSGEDRPLDEGRLEQFLLQVGPLLSVLLLLALHLFLRQILARSNPSWVPAALFACLALAIAPWSVELGLAGRLSTELCAGVLLLAYLSLLLAAWRSEDALDRLTEALFAGLVAGLGLLTSRLFLWVLPVAWLGWILVLAGGRDAEERRMRSREALLHFTGILLMEQLPTMDGPWQEIPPGDARAALHLTTWLVVAACLPFVLGVAPRLRRLDLLRGLGARARRAPSHDLLLALLSFALVVPFLRGESNGLLLSLTLVSLAASWLCRSGSAGWKPWLVPAALLVGLSLWFGAWRGEAGERAVERLRLVEELRGLRARTPSPGPWNSASVPQDWAVLCPPELGSLVLYHGRRPVCAVGSFSRIPGEVLAEVEASLAPENRPELGRRARALGARYVLLPAQEPVPAGLTPLTRPQAGPLLPSAGIAIQICRVDGASARQGLNAEAPAGR